MPKTDMPKNDPAENEPVEPERTDAAATAAVAEVERETEPAMAEVEIAGVKAEFNPKRLDDVRFRRHMQQRRDAVALDWLLGESTMNRVLDAIADQSADGLVDADAYTGIFKAIGDAVGAGNS